MAQAGNADAAEATRLLVTRLLHDPSEMLRAFAAGRGMDEAEQARAERLLRRVFRLDSSEDAAKTGQPEKDFYKETKK